MNLTNLLPAPSKVTGAWQDYRGSAGNAYISSQVQNVTPGTGNIATYSPNCDQAQPVCADIAWAIYAMTGVRADSRVSFNWSSTGNDFRYFVGVSDFSRDAWNWHEMADTDTVMNVPTVDQLNGDDRMLLAVVALGTDSSILNMINLATDVVGQDNLFFLHHSTGAGIIGGGMRPYIANYNTTYGRTFEFWDHGYNDDGLHDAVGNNAGFYDIPGDNTDPDGLHYLWTSSESDAVTCRASILANHDVIAFKSCYPASDIWDNDELNQRKTWYNEMLPFFDSHPEKVFVVMSTPPLHRLSTDSGNASRARQFANWLKSGEYLAGHPNVFCFDLFDELAKADDSSATANMLRYDYEKDHEDGDSHPNATANAAVAPVFAQFLIDASLSYDWPN